MGWDSVAVEMEVLDQVASRLPQLCVADDGALIRGCAFSIAWLARQQQQQEGAQSGVEAASGRRRAGGRGEEEVGCTAGGALLPISEHLASLELALEKEGIGILGPLAMSSDVSRPRSSDIGALLNRMAGTEFGKEEKGDQISDSNNNLSRCNLTTLR
eukprot:CAMPEP_0185795638 /NCGR_PEP_ID=MMETSP1174-20130828/160650_1 /TAXON_ID=35687 /ORGANISM="Dictyocha speculum, Strain CCMP1381" /LENGTH=157 /DNA_ID=CAMNT_0028490939 /DNA_START=744 /DNA_END=1217 /DNA_ORIENTATION=+